MNYKVGSLFAGVGGICLGFKNASFKETGYQLEWANEIDEYASVTYRHNFKHSLIEGDIEKIVLPDREKNEEIRDIYISKRNEILSRKIDVLTAGFPCQAFSIAGERKGFDDHRGNLFMSIVDLIRLIETKQGKQGKPSVLLLENVKNLKNHDKGNTYKVIKEELENLEYIVKEEVLNTKDFTNLPQNRERIFIVGFLDKDVADNFKLFDDEDYLNKLKKNFTEDERKNNINKVLDLSLNKKELKDFYYTKEKYPNYFLTQEDYSNLDEKDRKDNRINLDEEITEEYEFYQIRRGMYVRKNQSGVCPTLTANMGTGGHNVALIKVKDGIRKLTPSETFKLQGFPINNNDDYKLPTEYNGRPYSKGRLYKQAGNSVSVDIVKLIAEEILKSLYLSNKKEALI